MASTEKSKSRFLLAFIISISILVLAVAGKPHGHHQRASLRGVKLHKQSTNSGAKDNPSNHQVELHSSRNHSLSGEFLRAHNKVRLHFREPLFVWDRTLARYARRYATQRAGDCRMVHSMGQYGENIFWGSGNHWTPTEIVRSWVSEHRFYNKIANVCEPGRLCGHYTQIVWKDSVRLGCAKVDCNNGGMFAICSYDPPGNYLNENPF